MSFVSLPLILGWIRRLRVDLFSSSAHWAEVMAEADTLKADFNGQAVEVAHQREQSAFGPESRALFRDVGYVLEARDEPAAPPVRTPSERPSPTP